MRLFGKAQKAPESSLKDGVVKIRETLEMLEKREKHLQSKIDKEVATARANAQKNKNAALMALKRKRMHEGEITKLLSMRGNLEQQLMQIETTSMNLEVMKTMDVGAKVMKQIHGAMDINQVDKTMDDIRDQMDLADEISNAISQPLGGQYVDEDELMQELEELEQAELDSKLLDVNQPVNLNAPSVPSDEPVIKTKKPTRTVEDEEAAELAALQAEMAM